MNPMQALQEYAETTTNGHTATGADATAAEQSESAAADLREQVAEAQEQLAEAQQTVAVLTTERDSWREQAAELPALRTELATLKQSWERLWAGLHSEAKSRRWCDTYDTFVDEYGGPDYMREHQFTYNLDARLSIDVNITEEVAFKDAGDRMDALAREIEDVVGSYIQRTLGRGGVTLEVEGNSAAVSFSVAEVDVDESDYRDLSQ